MQQRRQLKRRNSEMKTTEIKKRKKMRGCLRAVIQLLYFLFFPAAYTSAFSGVKYIFTQIGMKEPVALTSFTAVLLVLCVYTIIFGRFFCGFACAFGSLGDAFRAGYVWICKKCRKKPISIPVSWEKKLTAAKYLLFATILIISFAGVSDKLQAASPWEVFSMLQDGHWRLGGYVWGIIILILLMAGMCVCERFFCRFFCPMGAVFSILPVLPFFSLHRDREQCLKGCSACRRKCPADLELTSPASMEVSGECFQCQKCIDACPKRNIRCGVKGLKGNEEWFTLLRTALLLGLFLWLGI